MTVHTDDLFGDSPLPSGLPMCVSLVLWDSLHLNLLEKKNTITTGQQDVSYLTAMTRLPFIQNPTTSRHRSVNQAFFYWSLLCQFHNTRFNDHNPLSVDAFIPFRVSQGVRYAIIFGRQEHQTSSQRVMDLDAIPQDALCKIWFTFSAMDLSLFRLNVHPPPTLTLHHIEVCTEPNALTHYVDRPLTFHYALLPPMMTAANSISYKTIIFAVMRYYKHHSFVIPLDAGCLHTHDDRVSSGLQLFDAIDAFKTHFFLPLQGYLSLF